MDELVVFELTCSYCAKTFVVCRPDYRGQGYCKDVCRELGQAALRRLANAKHQRSEEGRRDHAEHQRALVTRKRAEAQAVTDASRQKVAFRAEWSAPDDPPMLTTSKVAADGEADADEIHGRDGPVGDTDPRAREPRDRRALAGDLAATLGDTLSGSGVGVSAGIVAVARREAPRCIVCGRAGGRVLPRPDRRDGPRPALDLLRCRSP